MRTALIIGAGSNVGHATAHKFAEAGYTVATASRSGKLESQYKHFTFDASKPETVTRLFEQVRKAVGTPSVVIYNAYSDNISQNPFGNPLDMFTHDMHVNATSAWAATRETVKGFEALGSELGKEGGTFIFTGNILNDTAAPGFVTFAMGKSASAIMIKNLAMSNYADKPYKFYYGDQRNTDGSPMYTGLSGKAHADFYFNLAQDPKQGPWQALFVEGKGYVDFPRVEAWAPGS